MANPKNLDLTEEKLFWIASGIVYSVCCCPTAWDAQRVGHEATVKNPPGTSANRWVVSDPQERSDDFSGRNTMPCPDDPERTHWLINC